ncbi:MAG: retropepsin-like aspartic protease [Blastocatellia bacterium]
MPVYDASLFNPPAPLARVTLRNPANRNSLTDIAMLIDTGADITLIPQASANQLGLTIDPNTGYELMAFDGSTSVAQIVQLDLLFLRRVFRGRFLLTSQEYGILGRDILNHIRLVFDGPHLRWEE